MPKRIVQSAILFFVIFQSFIKLKHSGVSGFPLSALAAYAPRDGLHPLFLPSRSSLTRQASSRETETLAERVWIV
jgi:hypothetical protein